MKTSTFSSYVCAIVSVFSLPTLSNCCFILIFFDTQRFDISVPPWQPMTGWCTGDFLWFICPKYLLRIIEGGVGSVVLVHKLLSCFCTLSLSFRYRGLYGYLYHYKNAWMFVYAWILFSCSHDPLVIKHQWGFPLYKSVTRPPEFSLFIGKLESTGSWTWIVDALYLVWSFQSRFALRLFGLYLFWFTHETLSPMILTAVLSARILSRNVTFRFILNRRSSVYCHLIGICIFICFICSFMFLRVSYRYFIKLLIC